jgi:hypothetical protein
VPSRLCGCVRGALRCSAGLVHLKVSNFIDGMCKNHGTEV